MHEMPDFPNRFVFHVVEDYLDLMRLILMNYQLGYLLIDFDIVALVDQLE